MMSAAPTTNGAPLTGAPACPICGGRMWDNRASKRSPRAPDFKCRNPRCDGRIWPGQHNVATPIVAPHAGARGAGEPLTEAAATTEPTGEDNAGARDTQAAIALRQRYLAVTDFVLAEVRTRYEAAQVPCGDVTVAVIVATLFIASYRGRGV